MTEEKVIKIVCLLCTVYQLMEAGVGDFGENVVLGFSLLCVHHQRVLLHNQLFCNMGQRRQKTYFSKILFIKTHESGRGRSAGKYKHIRDYANVNTFARTSLKYINGEMGPQFSFMFEFMCA